MISLNFDSWLRILKNRHVKVNNLTLKVICSEAYILLQNEALGLLAAPKIPVPKFIPNTTPMVSLVDLKYSAENSLLIERALARAGKKIEDIPSTSKKRTNIVPPAPQPPAKKSKKGVSCRICVGSHFAYQSDLNE